MSEPTDPFPPANRYNPLAWIVGEPEIGEGCWIGAFTLIDGSGGLRIGRGVDVSCGAQIYTHSTAKRCVSARAHESVECEPTTIGDHVFIGANATVLMGTTIGERSVVAAGAVVTADVEPYTIVAGVPARRIGRVVLEGSRVEFVYESDIG
jgi:acetyltransferase-like isoleucine patch superfamily enzyme